MRSISHARAEARTPDDTVDRYSRAGASQPTAGNPPSLNGSAPTAARSSAKPLAIQILQAIDRRAGTRRRTAPTISEAERRERAFLERFHRSSPDRPIEEGRRLFELAGGHRPDTAEGFLTGEDLAPTLTRAVSFVRDARCTIWVVGGAMRNLAGLNERFGHTRTDAIYGACAQLLRRDLETTGASVIAFRDGGEMTFVLAWSDPGPDEAQASIDAAIGRAQRKIEAYIRELGLEALEHPRYPNDPSRRGVGVSTATGRIHATDTVATVQTGLREGIERYHRDLGQVPAPYPAIAPSPAIPPLSETAPRAPKRPVRFRDQAYARRRDLIYRAANAGISKTDALSLFELTGSGVPDPITGFARAEDRVPTMERALGWIRSTGEDAFYVEMDLMNLGGLGRAIGRKQAALEFRVCAEMIREELAGLEADVCLFHHGGDELSAIIVAPKTTLVEIDTALARAQSRFTGYIDDRGLAEIPHPKHPDDPSKRGVSFTFATAHAAPNETPQEIFSRADRALEQEKAKPR